MANEIERDEHIDERWHNGIDSHWGYFLWIFQEWLNPGEDWKYVKSWRYNPREPHTGGIVIGRHRQPNLRTYRHMYIEHCSTYTSVGMLVDVEGWRPMYEWGHGRLKVPSKMASDVALTVISISLIGLYVMSALNHHLHQDHQDDEKSSCFNGRSGWMGQVHDDDDDDLIKLSDLPGRGTLCGNKYRSHSYCRLQPPAVGSSGDIFYLLIL